MGTAIPNEALRNYVGQLQQAEYLSRETNQETFCFGRALTHLKVGGQVKRKCWGERLPAISSKNDMLRWVSDGQVEVYWPTQPDMHAEDWLLL